MKNGRFNIRVYGLYLHPQNGVLVTDEIRSGMEMTKFPGGGLNFGEGLSDALIREFREELMAEVSILNLFYINDFYQQSAFIPTDQIISVYYNVIPKFTVEPVFAEERFAFPERKENAQIFRYVRPEVLDPEEFTFPIDRIVAGMLKTSGK